MSLAPRGAKRPPTGRPACTTIDGTALEADRREPRRIQVTAHLLVPACAARSRAARPKTCCAMSSASSVATIVTAYHRSPDVGKLTDEDDVQRIAPRRSARIGRTAWQPLERGTERGKVGVLHDLRVGIPEERQARAPRRHPAQAGTARRESAPSSRTDRRLGAFVRRSGLVKRIPARVAPGAIGFLNARLSSDRRSARSCHRQAACAATRRLPAARNSPDRCPNAAATTDARFRFWTSIQTGCIRSSRVRRRACAGLSAALSTAALTRTSRRASVTARLRSAASLTSAGACHVAQPARASDKHVVMRQANATATLLMASHSALHHSARRSPHAKTRSPPATSACGRTPARHEIRRCSTDRCKVFARGALRDAPTPSRPRS